MKSPVELLRSLLKDLERLHPEVEGLDRDFHTIQIRFKHEGFSFLAKTLPILGEAFIEGLSLGRFTCPRNFLKVPRGSIPRFLSGMICKVFDSHTGLLKENPPSDFILSIIQVTMLLKKCLMDKESSDKLETEAVQAFFEVEQDILKVLPQDFLFYLEHMSRLILPNLERDLDIIEPKHGPGAVYEGLRGNQKWSSLWESVQKHDSLSSYHFDSVNILDRIDLSSTDQGLHSSNDGRIDIHIPDNPCSIARLVTVPKSSTSRRTITVEPLLNQFVQQGLNIKLRDEIEKCGILSLCLALTDQSKNNNLARIGSLTGDYATIDLKSASDLLSVKLVEACFSWKNHFFQHMMDCRSKSVQYKNNTVQIQKFAGMGNALTFPVQSICFALISIASILRSDGKFPSYRNVQRAARHIRVYGDDIIISSKYAPQVVSGLHSVGLKVNTKKSFLVGSYRESCGTDYYAGVLVTPTYVRCLPETNLRKADTLGKLIAASNQLWRNAYYEASTYLYSLCKNILGRDIPLSRNPLLSYNNAEIYNDPVHLGLYTRRGWQECQRWHPYLHTWTVKGPVISSRKERLKLDGCGALLKFYFTPLVGRSNKHLEYSPRRYHTKISMRWMQA